MAGIHEYLSGAHPEWGRIGILSWDTEIFGFAVADFEPGDARATFSSRVAFAETLPRWAEQKGVELISCSVLATDSGWRALLPGLGFHHVDTTLTYAIPRVRTLRFDRHTGVRLATEADRAAVERIAEQGFNAGRYHADPFFPRALANRRYRHFVRETFATLSHDNRVYVTSEHDPVTCFMHTRLRGETGEVVLGGTDPAAQGTVVPLTVWCGALMDLKQSGIRRLESKLSVGNTPMMNIATYAGARFSEAHDVYHWHAPGAPHLHNLDALFTSPGPEHPAV